MEPRVDGIVLGVEDLSRAKQFYGEGLGWPVQQEQGDWVSFRSAEGSTPVALFPLPALAEDAGVPVEGSGFRGITLSHIVSSNDEVDAVMAQADRAGGTIAKAAGPAPWGGYSGHFADPDGHLWKVVARGTA
jgi:hypothetical protein